MRRQRDPSPEELGAFLDGELDPALGGYVEQWLSEHLAVAADLEEQRQLQQMMRASAAPAPAWSGVSDRIADTVAAERQKSGWRRATVAAAAVAASLLGLLFYRSPALPVLAEEPLVLASADEIEIHSMDAGDGHALVVGHPPLREPLVLANPEDISIDGVEPDATSGMMPSVHWVPGGGDAPVVVAATLPREE